MHPFDILRRPTTKEVVAANTKSDTRLIAGGTNLVDLMKLHIETPRQLVDINNLDLKKIESLPDGGLRIGALVSNTQLAYHPDILERFPLISQAILSGASPQLRNVATVGGNILQRTRCPYFYDIEFACNKRSPGAGCSALNGYNRSHAILGTSKHCIATHPSDMCVAFAALGATLHIEGTAGKRQVPFRDFHTVPASTPNIENVLRAGDLITEIDIPATAFAKRSVYLKVRDRSSYEFALSSVAVALSITNGKISDARIALGGVGTKPWHSPAAEQALRSQDVSETSFRRAAEAALEGAVSVTHNMFKVELATKTLIRALTMAAALV